ncbi:hypothetical protein E2C01_007139 [Portunus trituberculatus]|uniref:Uncharacterized protein n=1 Tax=Portunus trituberculatus TaxID=210409 RepID=A0A5B7D049_PORTR|nr:hypothetical protein [Portunus trituberculatus]
MTPVLVIQMSERQESTADSAAPVKTAGCRALMSDSENRTALPPKVSGYGTSRRASSRAYRDSVRSFSRGSSSDSPARQGRRCEDQLVRHRSVNKPHRRMGQSQPQAAPSQVDMPEPPWKLVLEELARLKSDVAKLTVKRIPSPQQVNFQVNASPAAFSGFVDSRSEDGEIRESNSGDSVLLQAVKALGPHDSVSEDIEPQVAAMEEDYRAISEDPVTRRPNNCPALATVECNPQISGALKTDPRKADSRLKEVSGDIISASTIITKSLLALDKVAQDVGNSVVVQEVSKINGALAMLGHANYRTNLARRFIMKREINPKYSHLCSDKVPMSRFLFGDDVSQSAKQIEETEKPKNKLATKKPLFPGKSSSSRPRSFWGKSTFWSHSARFQPYGQQRWGFRSGQRQHLARQDSDPKNAKGRGHQRPRQ